MKRNDSENKPTVPALDKLHQANASLPITNYHGLCFVIDTKGMIKTVDNIYKRTRINYPCRNSFYDLLSPATKAPAKAIIESVCSGMPTSNFTVDAFLKGKTKQSLSIVACPFSEDNEVKQVSLICHELAISTEGEGQENTPLHQELQDLKDQNKDLTKANKFLDSFVTGAAHDLRSPLVVLKTFPDLIRRFKDEKKKTEGLNTMKEATIRMENILNNMMELLDFQKNGTHKEEELCLDKVCRTIFSQLSFETGGIYPLYRTNFDAAPTINYYKAHLISIIYNLVGNAIKYRKEEEELVIDITSQQKDNYTLITIKDNGVGMDLEKFGHLIFQPFKRLNTTQGGSGLGLSMIKSNIELNGGKIEVESKQGVGSTFYVYLVPHQK